MSTGISSSILLDELPISYKLFDFLFCKETLLVIQSVCYIDMKTHRTLPFESYITAEHFRWQRE